MDHAEIIKRLGGVDAVAHAIGYNRSAIASWRDRNNIPARVWIDLVQINGAKRLGVTLVSLAESVKGRKL